MLDGRGGGWGMDDSHLCALYSAGIRRRGQQMMKIEVSLTIQCLAIEQTSRLEETNHCDCRKQHQQVDVEHCSRH